MTVCRSNARNKARCAHDGFACTAVAGFCLTAPALGLAGQGAQFHAQIVAPALCGSYRTCKHSGNLRLFCGIGMALKMLQQGSKKYAGADKRAGDVTGQAHKADCAPVDYGPGQNKRVCWADGHPVH